MEKTEVGIWIGGGCFFDSRFRDRMYFRFTSRSKRRYFVDAVVINLAAGATSDHAGAKRIMTFSNANCEFASGRLGRGDPNRPEGSTSMSDNFDTLREDFEDVLRQLEGSTHGGPRQHQLYETLRTMVDKDPIVALDMVGHLPTSARSILLMAVSGLGRRVLSQVRGRLGHDDLDRASDAAMILYIWSQRGLISAHDVPSIVAASDKHREAPFRRIIDAVTRKFDTN